MAQTNNLWSNLLLAATKNPRMMAGLLGIANPSTYLTSEEQQQAEGSRNWGINAIANATKPFAKGANILAQGYGDLYRGVSGKTDYVSPLESYIKSGISQEEMGRINTNPYKEILKSGAGMAATLAPVATQGLNTLNYVANPLANKALQYGTKGLFEGLLGGYGHSRDGKELQDTMIGGGLGTAGELLGGYISDPSFRNMLNENVSRGTQMGVNKLRGYGEGFEPNGMEVSAQNKYASWLDKASDEGRQDLDVIRDNALRSINLPEGADTELSGYYKPGSQNPYHTDIELLQKGNVKKTPEALNYLIELKQRGLVDPTQIDITLELDYGITPEGFDDFVQYLGDGNVLKSKSLAPEIIGGEFGNGSSIQDTVSNRTKLIRDYMDSSGVVEPTSSPDAYKELLKTYRKEGFLTDQKMSNPVVNEKTGETLKDAVSKLRKNGWSAKDIAGYEDAVLGKLKPRVIDNNKI